MILTMFNCLNFVHRLYHLDILERKRYNIYLKMLFLLQQMVNHHTVLLNIYLFLFVESGTTNPDKQIQSSNTYDISGMFGIHVCYIHYVGN